ncbi:MAG: hypothetical protein WBP45_13710 [Daejeonella sp.]
MGLFDIFKKKEVSQEKEKTYLEVNLNKFHYTDGGTPEKLSFLQGQIKQLTQFSYEIEKGKQIFESSTAVFSFIFDRDKNIIEELRYRSENEISSTTKYLNKKILSVHRYFIPNIVTSKDIYQYNDKGECISFTQYRYDDNGNEIKSERLFYDSAGKCFKKEIIENSESKFELFNKSFYNPLNPPQYENLGEEGYRQIIQLHDSKTIDTFDKFQNFLASRRYDSNGDLVIEIEATYDQEYRRKTYSVYDYKNKTKTLSHYHYDENGLLIKLGNPNIESDTITYENDKFGNIIKKFTKWRKTIPEDEFEYEYDEFGNWTKRIWKYREKIINIRTRQFEYY